MHTITQQQINDRYNELASDNRYITELMADMYDAEGNNHSVTIEDVARLRNKVFNKGYLRTIAKDQLIDEHCCDIKLKAFI
jgi:hypothetical protein